MKKKILEHLDRLDLRDVWRHEATEFTAWFTRPKQLTALEEAAEVAYQGTAAAIVTGVWSLIGSLEASAT